MFAAVDGDVHHHAGTRVPLAPQWVDALRKKEARRVPGLKAMLSEPLLKEHHAGRPFASLAIPLRVRGHSSDR